jgi:DNA replication protein DnaC
MQGVVGVCLIRRFSGKTHLATGLGITAANHGHRVLFATATEWVTRLTDADRAGPLPAELTQLRRYD